MVSYAWLFMHGFAMHSFPMHGLLFMVYRILESHAALMYTLCHVRSDLSRRLVIHIQICMCIC